jgi:RsiW-degrading membrane proteinase PrsW (M82 family)
MAPVRMSDQDPVAEAADDSRDLHDVATWEERTRFDRLAVAIHGTALTAAHVGVVVLALLLFLSLFVLGGLGAVLVDLLVAAMVSLSALPAFGLAAYVYRADVTMDDPLWLLIATFCLDVLLATLAALVNSAMEPLFSGLFLGTFVFFYLVVAPIEETVKLLAVRLYAYTTDRFDSMLDGAAFGAMAGLGFTTIENALYVSRSVGRPSRPPPSPRQAAPRRSGRSSRRGTSSTRRSRATTPAWRSSTARTPAPSS